MIELRPYQINAIKETVRKLHRNPILVSPTGTGKTITAVNLINAIRGRVLWVAHRIELIKQAKNHILKYCNEKSVGLIMAGEPENPDARIQIASIQTLRNRNIEKIDSIIVDECHHAISESYRSLFTLGVPVVGLTATPYRLDGKPLGDLFGEIIVAITELEAVKAGYLVDADIYACDRPNLSEIKTTGGDFNTHDLSLAMNKPRLTGGIVEQWKKRMEGRKTLVFATSIVHSLAIRDEFLSQGINAAHVDGNTPRDERSAILASLKDGDIQVLSNVDILTEGYDLPELGGIVIARPTMSLCLHRQIIGRGVRSSIGKGSVIINDHAGNHHRHGRFTRPLEYSLTGKVKTARTIEPLGLRTCPACFRLFEPSKAVCPICLTPVQTQVRRKIREDAGDLIEFDDCSFEYRSEVWNMISDRPDAAELYRFRFKENPIILDGRLLDVDSASKAEKKEYFKQILLKIDSHIVDKNKREEIATARYKGVFGSTPFWLTPQYKSWIQKRVWK